MFIRNKKYRGFILIAALVFSFYGCFKVTEKDWREVATDTDVTQKKKDILAPKAAILWPSTTKFIPGEIVVRTDTVVDVESLIAAHSLIDSLLYLTDMDSLSRDSLRAVLLSKVKAKIVKEYSRIVDTFYTSDPRIIETMQGEIDKRNSEVVSLKTRLADETDKANSLTKTKLSWLYWFIGSAVLNLIFLILLLKRR